jgi:hypothetical protein
MSTIDRYLQEPGVFDPETLALMGIAYECALKSFPTPAPQNVREVIAVRIIGRARDGERDPDNLCRIAVLGLQLEAVR